MEFSDGQYQNDDTDVMAMIQMMFQQMSEFYYTDNEKNRRTYMNLYDFGEEDEKGESLFGQMWVLDLY